MTPGRTYEGETEDYGFSGQIDYDFGFGTLTSITGYRVYDNFQGSDTDYSQVDILYRAPGRNAGARRFETFSQELRLQGKLFDDRLAARVLPIDLLQDRTAGGVVEVDEPHGAVGLHEGLLGHPLDVGGGHGVEGLEGLLHGDRAVLHVDLVQVEPVGAQRGQRVLGAPLLQGGDHHNHEHKTHQNQGLMRVTSYQIDSAGAKQQHEHRLANDIQGDAP